jgi:hypothetical protein
MVSKTEILAEIKRTALANGGKPLGIARFEQETGIKEYEWGQHWARFGDAQREAGFEPNQLKGAHPDDFLLVKMIKLIRKLGKYPTFREIEVERRADAEMPTKKVFQRVGSKEHFAQMLLAYCASRNGFDDVIQISKMVLEKRADEEEEDDGEATSDYGEVYLFKSGQYFKIGRTSDTVRRGNEIRIQLPEKMTLVHSIKTDDPPGIEAYWHKRFEGQRMKGEWFDLKPADVKAFKRWRRIS